MNKVEIQLQTILYAYSGPFCLQTSPISSEYGVRKASFMLKGLDRYFRI